MLSIFSRWSLCWTYLLQITIKIMGNKSLRKRKYDRTWDDTHKIEQRKELYRRKKQEHVNIEEINDDNVNRDVRQEEVQPGMHAHIWWLSTQHTLTHSDLVKLFALSVYIKVSMCLKFKSRAVSVVSGCLKSQFHYCDSLKSLLVFTWGVGQEPV